MPLTRSFKETVQNRARKDAAFLAALLKEACDELLADDAEAGRTIFSNIMNSITRSKLVD